MRVILLKTDTLALIEVASFYLILLKLNKRYSGEQEIASEKTTPIYNSRNNCSNKKRLTQQNINRIYYSVKAE